MKIKYPILFLFVLAIIVGILSLFFRTTFFYNSKDAFTVSNQDADFNSADKIDTLGKYEVVLKENSNDERNTDVYLKDQNEKELLLFTLENVYRGHYHAAQYRNGFFYIIIRSWDENAFPVDPQRKDELWRYDLYGNKVKLYEVLGLDFQASSDGKYVLIVGDSRDPIMIIDQDGDILYTFKPEELAETEDLSSTYAYPEKWDDQNNRFILRIKSSRSIDEEDLKVEYYEWVMEMDPVSGSLEKTLVDSGKNY